MWKLYFTAIGLAADAFAVSVCKGLSLHRISWRSVLTIGLYFGFFQGIMPVFGYILGEKFRFAIESVDHWVAFFLLLSIGISMIMTSFREDPPLEPSVSIAAMLPLALSTSIDALAVGITFSIEKINIRTAALTVAIITAMLSVFGVVLGNRFGAKQKKTSERIGGCILIWMGCKLLIEHLHP